MRGRLARLALLPAAGFALTPYSQDFEGLNQTDTDALSGDGWLVFGNVSTPAGAYMYGYGPYPAPTAGGSSLDDGQGGVEQGLQQLAVFNDYNNGTTATAIFVESNVYREQIITADDVARVEFRPSTPSSAIWSRHRPPWRSSRRSTPRTATR